MLLVTGATGTVGREVVRRLPAHTPVRLLTRDASRVSVSTPASEVVVADYTEPGSLRPALRGVRSALLVTHPLAEDHDEVFLRAAADAGVAHVVKLSAAAVTEPRAQDVLTRRQRANEELLRGAGPAWTLLRPRAFMSNTLSWAPAVRSRGVVSALYGTSPNSCVDPRDIAAVAARVLTGDGHHGRAYTLTGPRAISAAEQTEQLGRVVGRRLRFEELTEERARASLTARHGARAAEALLESARRQRDGAKAAVTDAVREVTGRPARPFAAWAREHAHLFSEVPAV